MQNFQINNDTHSYDETIFTEQTLEALKAQEITMSQRNKKGYHQCKIVYEKLYTKITEATERFCTYHVTPIESHLLDVENKAMITSVEVVTPKDK